MSQFIDKLKQVSTGGQPMGFRAAAAAPKPRMLLVVAVAQVDTERLADSVAGADAGLLSIARVSAGAKSFKQLCQAAPDIPWGGWLEEAVKEGIGKLVEAGADFAVFPAGTSLFEEEKVGKVLEVEPSLEPGLVKAINELPVDAVLIAGEEDKKFLTWRHLMLFQRCANLLSKPLLVSVPPEVSASELGTLWEAGVRGVVVKAGAKGKMGEIRRMLEKLPLPSAGKRRKVEPLLPRIGGETGVVSEEEEEE